MSHGPHNVSYSPTQIFHDGCGECAARVASANRGVSTLDGRTFREAWRRAAAWNQSGLPDVCGTEAPLLSVLWAVQVQLERTCGLPPGELPIVDVVQRNVLAEHAAAVRETPLGSGHSEAFESLMAAVREARAARPRNVEQARAALAEWQDGGEYPA